MESAIVQFKPGCVKSINNEMSEYFGRPGKVFFTEGKSYDVLSSNQWKVLIQADDDNFRTYWIEWEYLQLINGDTQ